MNPKQQSLYFREWGYVRGYCKAKRLPEPDRHDLHVQALGMDKSSKDFTNEDLDKVLAVFRAVHQPANLNAQLRQLRQPRKRAEFPFPELLKLLGLYIGDPEAYVAEICHDKFRAGVRPADWRALSDVQLQHLRYTLNRCLNGKCGLRNQAGDSIHDMRTKARLECGCRICHPRAVISFVNGNQLVSAMAKDNEPF